MAPDFMTFGVPTRPSTPVYDLIENRFVICTGSLYVVTIVAIITLVTIVTIVTMVTIVTIVNIVNPGRII